MKNSRIYKKNMLIAGLVNASEIIFQLTDDEICVFDDHGYCQTHNWFSTNEPCINTQGKQFLGLWSKIHKINIEKLEEVKL